MPGRRPDHGVRRGLRLRVHRAREPRPKLGRQLARRRRAPSRIRVETAPDDVGQLRWRADDRWRRRSLRLGQGDRVVGLVRRPAGEHLGQHDPDAVDVDRRPRRLAAELLRREVAQRAGDGPGRRQSAFGVLHDPGDAEVDQPGSAVGFDQDVARLDVAMDDASLVGVGERLCDLRRDPGGFRGRQGTVAPDPVAQRLARDELEDHRRRRVVDVDIVDGDDARMRQRRRGAGLLFEARAHGRVREEVAVEHLDRDRPIEHRVARQPDLGAAAIGQALLEHVALGEARRELGRIDRTCSHAAIVGQRRSVSPAAAPAG